METVFINFIKKNFKLLSNINFSLALIVTISQVLISGTDNVEFEVLLKPLNAIFAILVSSISIYLFLTAQQWYFKFARLLFLIISIFYLLISILWWMNLYPHITEIYELRMFLALVIGGLSLSFKIADLGNYHIHPALLFLITFIFLIFLGALCLLLPAAHTKELTFTQALFTSTSAVTVTGLAVLDTGKDFTYFGQVVIMILIQLGGLGVLTVTNIFALIFTSSTSFKNRMMMGELIKEFGSKNTYRSLFKVIMITLVVEMIGAFLIYLSLISNPVKVSSPGFLSIFHAVSAFCNAGFSTFTNSMYEETVKFNYFLQMVISWLIITGGLGYTVMINHYQLIVNTIMSKISKVKELGINYTYKRVTTSINSTLVLRTTAILLFAGTILFYIAEYNSTLSEHGFMGKIYVSFFNSTTARTAGFNNVNMADLGIPAVMLIMALMWIGASPASTGGGIKTTTFAIALYNLWNQILGKERLIINSKEVPSSAVNQVNAVILLSIFAISFGTFLIAFFEKDILFKDILFECISAYSTVGLSIGITGKLGEPSLYILIGLMFLGRVSFLTFLIGVFNFLSKKSIGKEPFYPKENVFIN